MAIRAPYSLDAPVGEEDGLSLHDTIAADAPDPLEMLLFKERECEARKARGTLPPKERAVLDARFAEEHMTLESIGTDLLGGLSREPRRQLERHALRRLRRKVDPALRLG
jgi:DNA-directed RNA polymerase sigma subunit (sigma70/sigma32)